MNNKFSLSHFLALFPTEGACLEEIKRLRFPEGIFCILCEKVTNHYAIGGRKAYSCEYCRHQVYPLAGTIFEKTTTPLQYWFYCMLLMTNTRGKISIKTLQREIGVTYKTAWRIFRLLKKLMAKNNGDLLFEPEKVLKINFFNAFEVKVVEKQQVG